MKRIGQYRMQSGLIDLKRGVNGRQVVWIECKADDVPEGHVLVPQKLILDGALSCCHVHDFSGDTYPHPIPCLGMSGHIPAIVFSAEQRGIATNPNFPGARRFRLEVALQKPPAGRLIPPADKLFIIATIEGQIRVLGAVAS